MASQNGKRLLIHLRLPNIQKANSLQHRKNELFIKLFDWRSLKNCRRFIVRNKLFSDNRHVPGAIWG